MTNLPLKLVTETLSIVSDFCNLTLLGLSNDLLLPMSIRKEKFQIFLMLINKRDAFYYAYKFI